MDLGELLGLLGRMQTDSQPSCAGGPGLDGPGSTCARRVQLLKRLFEVLGKHSGVRAEK